MKSAFSMQIIFNIEPNDIVSNYSTLPC